MNPVTPRLPAPPELPILEQGERLDSQPASDTSIRIKTIAQCAFIVLSSVCCVGILIGTVCASMGIGVAFMATVACVSGVALALLLAAKAWQQIAPFLPEPVRHIAYFIQSIVTGIFSIITLGIIFPIDLERRDPQEGSPTQTPILFIHGFCGSSNNWLYHRHRLEGAGYKNLFTINLGTPFHSIEQYAASVQQKVAEIQRITGQNDIILVGHSMGGLVARCYRYSLPQAQAVNVRKIITLGTPLDGTYMAYCASWCSAAAKQMEPASSFVRDLQKMASTDDTTEYFHIATKVDSIVIPGSSALEGGGRHMRTELLDATGHLEYLFSDATADLIIDELKRNQHTA